MADKDAFREKLEAQLKEWNARIDLLKAKAEKAKAEAKIEYSKDIENLKAKRDALRGKLAEWQSAGSEAMESIKAGVEKAAADLKSAIEKAASKFK